MSEIQNLRFVYGEIREEKRRTNRENQEFGLFGKGNAKARNSRKTRQKSDFPKSEKEIGKDSGCEIARSVWNAGKFDKRTRRHSDFDEHRHRRIEEHKRNKQKNRGRRNLTNKKTSSFKN